MAPLFAHLARDPVPATLMKNVAPNVFRWTERMNLAASPTASSPIVRRRYPPDDEIPPTLEPVLRLMFQDWGAELLANAAYLQRLGRQPTRPCRPGTSCQQAASARCTRRWASSTTMARLHDPPGQRAARAVALRQGRVACPRARRRGARAIRGAGAAHGRRAGDGDPAGAADQARELRAGAGVDRRSQPRLGLIRYFSPVARRPYTAISPRLQRFGERTSLV